MYTILRSLSEVERYRMGEYVLRYRRLTQYKYYIILPFIRFYLLDVAQQTIIYKNKNAP